jgi:hypothetical protein
MKRAHPAFINDLDYIHAWMMSADAFTAARPIIDPPPAYLVRLHGRPHCATCWDTGLCAECLGRYPQYCPADCVDGTCSCAAGQARRAAYNERLRSGGGVVPLNRG